MAARLPDHQTDGQLIEMLHRGAFGYFERYTNPANGLVADTSAPGSPCSIAAVGFALAAWPVAVERGWTTRANALAITLAAIRHFHSAQENDRDGAASKRGFFAHFLDIVAGARAWNSEISFIDTAILLAGMIVAAQFFDHDITEERELRERVDEIASRIDWAWTVDREARVRMGWKPGRGFLAGRWTGYSEALLMFVLGMGTQPSSLPPSSFRRWTSTFSSDGNDTLQRGPLFIHLFPQAFLDLRGVPVAGGNIDWFENTCRAIAAQRSYATENPKRHFGYGQDVWGITACDGPRRRVTLRNGCRRWIPGYVGRAIPYGPDDGTLAPWAALACLPYAPAESLRATRHILKTHPETLRDGRFVDAFNPGIHTPGGTGWVADRCTGIDQGLLVASIENYRSGLVWKLTSGSPLVSRGLQGMT